MKNLRIIKLLTALLIVSFSFSSQAEDSNLNKLYNNTDNTVEMSMEADLLLVELALNFQISSFPLIFDLNRIVMENDLVLEECLELEDWMLGYEWIEAEELFIEEEMEIEDWMLDYEWIEAEELLIEEDMEMEVWMERPKNWNMYECGIKNKNSR